MAEVPKAVQALAEGITPLQNTIDDLKKEWWPEAPPITTSMSDIGRTFAEDARLTPKQVTQVFRRIELILLDGTQSEKDAVATGFLEAIVSSIDRDPKRRWIIDHAGPEAKAYIGEWNRFCGRTIDGRAER